MSKEVEGGSQDDICVVRRGDTGTGSADNVSLAYNLTDERYTIYLAKILVPWEVINLKNPSDELLVTRGHPHSIRKLEGILFKNTLLELRAGSDSPSARTTK
jgi:hypothetical protein